jgi:hypothetical protein
VQLIIVNLREGALEEGVDHRQFADVDVETLECCADESLLFLGAELLVERRPSLLCLRCPVPAPVWIVYERIKSLGEASLDRRDFLIVDLGRIRQESLWCTREVSKTIPKSGVEVVGASVFPECFGNCCGEDGGSRAIDLDLVFPEFALEVRRTVIPSRSGTRAALILPILQWSAAQKTLPT